jgi:arsenate reductase (thioredoxin)
VASSRDSNDPHRGRPVDGDGSEGLAELTDDELERELTVAAAAADHRRMSRYQALLAERERRKAPAAGGALTPETEHHAAKAQAALEEEFAGIHDSDTIERLMSDSLARFADAPLQDFIPTLAYRLTRERLKAIARAAGKIPRDRPEILFIGLEGRGRSQMAAALAELRSEGSVFAHPVGTHIRAELDENVVAAMAELGVDLHQAYPIPLTEDVLAGADVVVTLGRSVATVDIPEGVRHADWRIGDPVGADLDEVRHIRDDLDHRVQQLITEFLPPPAPTETEL